MKIGPRALALIKRFEGLQLRAYVCPAGVLTIGYGSTGPHVHRGMTITEKDAEGLLLTDLVRFEEGVTRLVGAHPTTAAQFGAMVALAFNIGLGAFGKSSVLRLHNIGKYALAADAFGMWVKGGGRTLPGLVKRRATERELYLSS